MEREKFLEGVRVLDLSRLLPGPFATLRLADMGATVVKVEDPVLGDYARAFPPLRDGVGELFLTLNRGKKSVALDFKTPEGIAAMHRLVRWADVLVESYRPGVLAQFQLDAESLRAENPRLIYCSLTGYGQTGAMKSRAGHDVNYLAGTGVLDLVGARDGGPCIAGVQFGDLAGSMAAAEQIAAALFRRERTGHGAVLDIAITDVLFGWTAFPLSMARGGDVVERGSFFANGGIVGYQIYESRDGRHVALGALEAKFWNRFCDAVEHPEWHNRSMERADAGEPLFEAVRALFRGRDWADWAELGARVDCCLTPVLTLEEAMDSALARDRGAFFDGGGLVMLNSGCLTPGADGGAVPELGADNGEILSEAGYTEEEIEGLYRAQVLHRGADHLNKGKARS